MVTGGAAGIGRGITESLLEEGARVVIADVENPFFASAVRGITDAAHAGGFEVILVNTDEDVEKERAAVAVLPAVASSESPPTIEAFNSGAYYHEWRPAQATVAAGGTVTLSNPTTVKHGV